MLPDKLATDPPFDPSRYERVRTLGTGGAGTVYLARDRETGEQLALKKLDQLDQRSVLRFKREFRSLANLQHPNLIRLYDLGRGPDAWFLVMEYVEGHSLTEEPRRAGSIYATRDQRRLRANDQDADSAFFGRVADIFRQLASGIRAVHQAGMLHRDLKPGNVVVADTGRVVVLDFGLVRELDISEDGIRLTNEGSISGTPAYMSPEQASGQPLTEASDWYSFGVMLYELLCGQLPIEGRNVIELIQHKLQSDPQPLSDVGDGPPALRKLATDLVQRDPAARPSGEQIIAILTELSPESAATRVGTQSEELVPNTDVQPHLASAPLVGRDRELAQLRAAFERTRQSETVVVHVRGTSGVGKSALVENFLQEPGHVGAANVLTLRSRCYEREAMPFKALDGVMDALVADMLKLDDLAAAHLLPQRVVELSQLFPVLERLSSVRRLIASRPAGEGAEVRRRAEKGLNELITRLAQTRPLVIWIDDLQWGDLDSASVIKHWCSRNHAAPMLLIFSYRGEEVETSPCLKSLLDPDTAADGGVASQVFIDLAPLGAAEARAMCNERLVAAAGTPSHWIDRIVQEAGGSPFLVQQLVALAVAKQARGDADIDRLSMEELVLRTGALLAPDARALLNVLAIAGRPIAPHLALMAADIDREGRSHIHALQVLRLVRTRVIGGQRCLEVYHDRVREGVQSALSASEREQQHLQLLRILEIARAADPDWLHELALGANQRTAALRYGLLAAERSNAGLAFERAAELYTRCLTLNERPKDAAELWSKLALTLVRCRRGTQAADAYLKAADHSEPEARPGLWRLAASHLVRSGHFEEGEQLVRRVLELLHLDVPTSELGLMAAIGWERARIAVRGYEIKNHEPSEERARLRRTAELYGLLALETQLYEPLRAVLFQARALRLAYETTDLPGIARVLCLTAGIVCLSGTPRAARHSAELLARAAAISEREDSEDLAIELPFARALCAMLLGRPLEVLEHSQEAERAYAKQSAAGGHGDYFYMFAVGAVRLSALHALGRPNDARIELSDYLARARATGNRAAVLQMTLAQTLDERAFENCRGSRARLDAEREQLPKGSFGVLRLLHVIATMHAACATQDYAWALAKVELDWAAYLRAPIHGTAYTACIAHFAHARFVLNVHVAAGEPFDAARTAAPDLRELSRLPASPLRDGQILRVRARCAYLAGDSSSAIALLEKSAQALSEALYSDEPERDRFAMGCLLGGTQGALLCTAAVSALRSCGIAEPLEELRGFYPELFAAGLVKNR